MLNLDLTNTPDSNILPEGPYTVIVDECEVRDTKSGTGEYISVKYRVIEGPADGKLLFHMFNIKNDNPKAVEIGLSQLKSFMKCSGQKDFKLTNVLDLIGLKAVAIVKKRTDDYGEKNVISYFKPLVAEGSQQAQAQSGKVPF